MTPQKSLQKWYLQNKRNLPWRDTCNPYLIWLSEVILQQTRVLQGLPYYQRFAEKYPTVDMMARASEEEILKLWQGLGYYSRARNMHHTAQLVAKDFKGVFPVKYNELIRLKGIGTYTAAAIASFSAHEPVAVLDGNVFRVLARYYGQAEPINGNAGKKVFTDLANRFLDRRNPAEHNQSMMELGSLVCTPKNPGCEECPLQKSCVAFATGKQDALPVKIKKGKVKSRYLHYLYLDHHGKTAVYRRQGGDIWKNLYDLPCLESDHWLENKELNKALKKRNWPVLRPKQPPLFQTVHLLTHRRLEVRFYGLEIDTKPLLGLEEIWVGPKKREQLPIPRLLEIFFEWLKSSQS